MTCDLGRGWVGFSTTTHTAQHVENTRDGHIRAEGPQPVAATVRSLRWRSVPGRPGARTGIPDRGEGTRVRFLDHQGDEWLYFDRHGRRQYALLATPEPAHDPDDLRAYWADPAGRDR